MKKVIKNFDSKCCCQSCTFSRELYYPYSVEFGREFYRRVGLTYCLLHCKPVEPTFVCKRFDDLPF